MCRGKSPVFGGLLSMQGRACVLRGGVPPPCHHLLSHRASSYASRILQGRGKEVFSDEGKWPANILAPVYHSGGKGGNGVTLIISSYDNQLNRLLAILVKLSLNIQLEWKDLPEKLSWSAQRDPKEVNWYSHPIISPHALFCNFPFVSILLLWRCCSYPSWNFYACFFFLLNCILCFQTISLTDQYLSVFAPEFQQRSNPFIWYCYQI